MDRARRQRRGGTAGAPVGPGGSSSPRMKFSRKETKPTSRSGAYLATAAAGVQEEPAPKGFFFAFFAEDDGGSSPSVKAAGMTSQRQL